MNFSLAKEIYGLTPWCVDAISFQSLSSVLNNIQNGLVLEMPDVKYNTPQLYKINSDTRIITRPYGDYYNDGQLENADDFDGIGIININGPITKSGGNSTVGMETVSAYMKKMASDNRIKCFIVPTDSGGGASSAVQIMVDTINEIKATKPVYALVTKGGMAGSAAYGIISACTKIYSEDKMNIVGSIGTMIQFQSRKANSTDPDGVKHTVLYATKSTEKNKAFEEAANNDNYELLINDLLDPINENFIKQTLSNRPMLEGSNYDNGHTVFSKDAIGTFIDGIASFDEVVDMVVADFKNLSSKNNNKNNSNSNKMNKEELKKSHPETYSEIIAEGVAQEQERVKSWNAFKEIDPKSVSEGIASGLPIKQSEVNSFIVKATSVKKINDLKSDNAPDFTTDETKTDSVVVDQDTTDKKELEEAFNFDIKI